MASAILRPSSDVSGVWTINGGAASRTAALTQAGDLVTQPTAPSTTQSIQSVTNGQTQDFELTAPSDVGQATAATIWLYSSCAGDDRVTVSLRDAAGAQIGSSGIITFGSAAWRSVSVGTIALDQAAVNALRLRFVYTRSGGSGTAHIVSAAYVDLTYTLALEAKSPTDSGSVSGAESVSVEVIPDQPQPIPGVFLAPNHGRFARPAVTPLAAGGVVGVEAFFGSPAPATPIDAADAGSIAGAEAIAVVGAPSVVDAGTVFGASAITTAATLTVAESVIVAVIDAIDEYGFAQYGGSLFGMTETPTTTDAQATDTGAVSGSEAVIINTVTADAGAVTGTDDAATGMGEQTAHPASDVSAGSWTTQAGGTTNLYAVLDETSADDGDYVRSSFSPETDDIVEFALDTLTDPGSDLGHVLSYRIGKDAAGGDAIDLVVSLRQGASTVIASWTHTDLGAGFTLVEQTLTEGEAAAITDYSALRVRFAAVVGS